jgi:hypothetical protein
MGYLTTVTVYNDGLDLLKKHPEDFCRKLYEAAIRQKQSDFGVDYFWNFANVQQSRHADDHTVYVHMGNTVTEVNPWSKDFEDLMRRNPQFADQLIGYLDQTLRRLKRMAKETVPTREGG